MGFLMPGQAGGICWPGICFEDGDLCAERAGYRLEYIWGCVFENYSFFPFLPNFFFLLKNGIFEAAASARPLFSF